MKYIEKTVKSGSHIYLEGDTESENLFLLKKGKVELQCSCKSFMSSLKTVLPGDFFGFITAFSLRPRICTAIAEEDSTYIELTRENFFRYISDKTELTLKILGTFSKLLHEYDKLVLDIKPINLIYPQSLNLFKLGEFYKSQKKDNVAEYIFSKYMQLYPDEDFSDDSSRYLDEILSGSGTSGYEPVEDKNFIFYPDSSVIFCEHEPGDLLYFVKQGKVKIVKQNREKEIILAILGESEIFGELALLTSSPRSATAISSGGVKLMPVDRNNFRLLLQSSPELLKKIFISISQRLWFNHLRLGLMSYRKPVTKLYAFLENKLLEENVTFGTGIKHIFQFGIDELLEMNQLSHEKHSDVIDDITDNPYLTFHFGQITVTNTKEFISMVNMYKQRDHIFGRTRRPGRDEADMIEEETPTEGIGEDTCKEVSGTDKYRAMEVMNLLPELQNDDPIVRVNAVIKLGTYGTSARDAAGDLKNLLGDDVKNIRRNAARSLINILDPGESVHLFKQALESSDYSVRSSALTGLGEVNAVNISEIVKLLKNSLFDKSSEVRSTAARTLGKYGEESVGAIPELYKSLRDSDKSVRILAINSLENITSKDFINETISKITEVSKSDENRFVQKTARNALIKLNRKRKLLK